LRNRNSIVNYKKYYDKKLLRSTLGIIYLLFKIYQKNKSLRKIFSLLIGKDREILLKSSWDNAKIRTPWLLASWVGGIIASYVIGNFEYA